jgi:hypothetical protein
MWKALATSSGLVLSGATMASADLRGSFFVPELQVNAISSTDFEVLEGRSEGARTYWCAAAYYARFTLRQDSGNIYLTRAFSAAQTANGTRGVTFSLNTPGTTSQAVSLSISTVGLTKTVDHALQFCRDSDLEADN